MMIKNLHNSCRLRVFCGFVTLFSCLSASPAMGQSSAIGSAIMAENQDHGEKTISEQLDARHDACLDAVGEDTEQGYEDALIWKGDGGGQRARHCIAMALFALGHREEAAYRLENMASEDFIGTVDLRLSLYAQSADFWMSSGQYDRAYKTASTGLELAKDDIALRIVRARAYAKLGRWDYAEIDLTSALAFKPNHDAALRYRADARRRLGKFDEALRDIESALTLEPSVENALVRGEIIEAKRLAALDSSR